MPKVRNNDINDEPPLLMNGSGMPTTGISPVTIARLIKRVEANIKLSPPMVNLQNLSLALKAK